MTSSLAPVRFISLCLVALAAAPPATTHAQACTDCDGGMDASISQDAAVAQPGPLDGSVKAGALLDGSAGDAAVTTTVVTVGLDASRAASPDAGKSTNQSGVTWVHEGCALGAAATGRANAASYAGALAAVALLLRRRRSRRAL